LMEKLGIQLCHSSCHRSMTAVKRRTKMRQIRPEGSGNLPRASRHIMASSRQRLQLLSTLQPAPRLCLHRAASPLAWASVQPGAEKVTLNREAVESLREEGRKSRIAHLFRS
jgi:hypothetical protein